jgi:AcrR family transcriptional regulator
MPENSSLRSIDQGSSATARSPSTRGRKPRLSRELVVSEACKLMNETPLEELTLARLAKRINASVMSLYTYFPSRDALLDAAAEQVFTLFKAPPLDGARWQDLIFKWLWATQHLIDGNPVVLKVIFWDGHHSTSWLKTWWLPIAQILKAQGLDNFRLAFAMDWLSTAAMGMMVTQMDSSQRKQASVIADLGMLDREQQRLATELWLCLRDVDRSDALNFGFNNLIRGLEDLISGAVLIDERAEAK